MIPLRGLWHTPVGLDSDRPSDFPSSTPHRVLPAFFIPTGVLAPSPIPPPLWVCSDQADPSPNRSCAMAAGLGIYSQPGGLTVSRIAMRLSQFNSAHKGKPVLVLGTGPSAFSPELGQSQRFLDLASSELPIIGLNRAFDIPHIKINYQLSIDRIWFALLKKSIRKGQTYAETVWRSYVHVVESFKAWKLRYGIANGEWTIEDFVSAYRDDLKPHPEVWRFFRLCSPYAPFIRFSWANNSGSAAMRCPYPGVKFGKADKQDPFMYGQCFEDKLIVRNNAAQTGIHLAYIMGAAPIFLLGVDLTPADPKKRDWETGARYATRQAQDPIDGAFRWVAQKVKRHVHVVNLNPDTLLHHFERVKSVQEGLDHLEREIRRGYPHGVHV